MQWFFSKSCRLLAECATACKTQQNDDEDFNYLDVLKIMRKGSGMDELFFDYTLKRYLERLNDDTNKFVFSRTWKRQLRIRQRLKEMKMRANKCLQKNTK